MTAMPRRSVDHRTLPEHPELADYAENMCLALARKEPLRMSGTLVGTQQLPASAIAAVSICKRRAGAVQTYVPPGARHGVCHRTSQKSELQARATPCVGLIITVNACVSQAKVWCSN